MNTTMSPTDKAATAGKKRSKPQKPPKIDIKMSWCKSCGLCVEYCNTGTLIMDGIYPSVVAAEKCTRCLQCEAMCPDFAIQVEDTPEEGEGTSEGAQE